MKKPEPELTVTLPARTEFLKMAVELTRHIAALNQFDLKECQKIAVALDEAMTNVIKHSYHFRSEPLTIRFTCSPDALKIEILFTGDPPHVEVDRLDLDRLIREKRKGGLGVGLIRRIMDQVTYRTCDGVNHCEMVKWKIRPSISAGN